MKYKLSSLAIALILIFSGWLFPGRTHSQSPVTTTPDLATTIEHLINYVENSGLIFVRNGEKSDSRSASQHIRSKYNYFRSSITTPEQFIEKCAAKSMMSGSDYIVILSDGTEKKVRDWMLLELNTHRSKAAE